MLLLEFSLFLSLSLSILECVFLVIDWMYFACLIVVNNLIICKDTNFGLQVNSIQQADACKITPAKFSGSKEIVPLHFRKLVSPTLISNSKIKFRFSRAVT